MTTMIQGSQMRALLFGVRVQKAAANLPQTATGALFTVTGGRVLVTSIVGEVVTAIQNQACNAKLISTPTTGTAVDLCAATAITNKEAGSLMSITGLDSDGLDVNNAGHVPASARPVVVPIGTIGLNTTASNTGTTKWAITYIPLDDGAAVAAA